MNAVEHIKDAGVSERAGRRRTLFPGSIGSRGDPDILHAQDLTGLLDRVAIGFYLIDESDYPSWRGSGSLAWKTPPT